MSNKKRVVSASLSNGQRNLLLRRFNPAFNQVFCMQMTWAYDVTDDFAYPHQPLKLTLNGRHVGDGHECLVGYVWDPRPRDQHWSATDRPDGIPVHITLSTREGVPPARASQIDRRDVEKFDDIELDLRLHLRAASRLQPTRLAA